MRYGQVGLAHGRWGQTSSKILGLQQQVWLRASTCSSLPMLLARSAADQSQSSPFLPGQMAPAGGAGWPVASWTVIHLLLARGHKELAEGPALGLSLRASGCQWLRNPRQA